MNIIRRSQVPSPTVQPVIADHSSNKRKIEENSELSTSKKIKESVQFIELNLTLMSHVSITMNGVSKTDVYTTNSKENEENFEIIDLAKIDTTPVLEYNDIEKVCSGSVAIDTNDQIRFADDVDFFQFLC